MVYDNEAEKLAELEDMFNELMDIIIEEEKKQRKLVEQVEKIEPPYNNILFKAYIQGKRLVTVASEMHYDYDYMKKMHKKALRKFDNMTPKDTEKHQENMF